LPLTLGFLMISIMLVIVVTDASAVYLARRSLASAADGAALAAVQEIDEYAIYTSTKQLDELPLARVAETVADYQLQADPSGRSQLTGTLVDPTTVRVEGRRTVKLPVIDMLGIGSVTVTASAEAKSLVRPPAGP
jgi:Flp pilus assembly protein TadG